MGEKRFLKSITVLVFLTAALTQQTLGQVTEHFDDNNVTSDPQWIGTTANYQITGAAKQLQILDGSVSPSYLSTAFAIPNNHNVQWEFFLRQNFAPSNNNHTKVYLMSSQSNLSSPLDGYYLQFGEDLAEDAIKLFRQTGSTSTLVCAGPAGLISANPVIVRVKANRNVAGEWTIMGDYTGGSSFVAVSSGTDLTHTSSSYFGIRSNFTSTNDTNLFYDDIVISTTAAPDQTAPTITGISVLSATEMEIVFSENVNETTAETLSHFLIAGHEPESAVLQASEKVVALTWSSALVNGHLFNLVVNSISDVAGNVMSAIDQSVLFFQPVASQPHDIVISEFYPDPTPSLGLPAGEFIEIYNRSLNPFDLNGWKITDGTTITQIQTPRILLPGDFLVLCHSSDVPNFAVHGATMGFPTFPSLNNGGDAIKIINPVGIPIDSLVYSLAWYHDDEDKKSGGWTLERINPHDFCKDIDNWLPSVNSIGGTPGSQNSVYNITEDTTGPKLLQITQANDHTLTVLFDEKLKTDLPTSQQIVIGNGLEFDSIGFHSDYKSIDLVFEQALDSSVMYVVTTQNIMDCPGNLIQPDFASFSIKLDTQPPGIFSHSVLSDTTIIIRFSERIQQTGNISLHLVNGTAPKHTQFLSSKNVLLTFQEPFGNGVLQLLEVKNIIDFANNTVDSTGVEFLFFQQVPVQFKDVIITEVFPDPAPTIGLPESEFIEIYNRSNHPFDLSGWKLTDGTSIGTLTTKILLPGNYLIICANVHKSEYLPYGETMGLSVFPSLNNSSDRLKLLDANSVVVDSVSYSLSWYGSSDKDDGGYSLELVSPNDLCNIDSNWTSSVDIHGGTPGQQNSGYSNSIDLTGPKLISVVAGSANCLTLQFNEKLKADLPTLQQLLINDGAVIDSIGFHADYKSIDLVFTQPLDSAQTYSISVQDIFDCPGNIIQPDFNSFSIKIDSQEPVISSFTVLSDTTFVIQFSERIQQPGVTTLLASGIVPKRKEFTSTKTLLLTFSAPFANGVNQILSIKNIRDFANNNVDSTGIEFLFFQPITVRFKDVIITEIFSDPAPTTGLPESEFIEIYNRSNNPFDLAGWKFTDGTSVGIMPSQVLLPGHYLVICANIHKIQYLAYGETMGLSLFPSLNNSSDHLKIMDGNSIVVDSVNYSLSWFKNADKDDGGYSLELISPNDLCNTESNWTASVNINGGTPGQQNSVYSDAADVNGPKLLFIAAQSAIRIALQFDEKLQTERPAATNFVLTPTLAIGTVSFADESLTRLDLTFVQPVDSAQRYTIQVVGIHDCPGNPIQEAHSSGSIKLDTLHPQIVTWRVISSSQLEIEFSKRLKESTALLPDNFRLNGIASPQTIQLSVNQKIVQLDFTPSFSNGMMQKLAIQNIEDMWANKMDLTEIQFLFFNPFPVSHKDIIISEIFADPSPVIGLPEAEFVEVYNRSQHPIDLKGWTISDGGAPAILSTRILLPNSFLILCATNKVSTFAPLGATMGVTLFPSLNNTEDHLILKNELGLTIDSLLYSDDWYRDDEKKEGGYSLELIDTENICAEDENWIASESLTGGTPGIVNSVNAQRPDLTGPIIQSIFAKDSITVVVSFNEKLRDEIPAIQNFGLNPIADISSVAFSDQSLRSIIFTFSSPLTKGIKYTLTATTVQDCAGNEIASPGNVMSFALPEDAELNDVIVNEILFNPTSTGVDFVEVFNFSSKYINIKNWKIANLVNDTIKNEHVITTTDLLIDPATFIVFTESPTAVKSEYIDGIESTFLRMQLPSFPDDEGSVALLDDKDKIIDVFKYRSDMHSVFLKSDEGVSLERIHADQPNTADNWKSASASSGYATPGYINSNALLTEIPDQAVTVQPEIFSLNSQPNFASIHYQFEKGGFVANVKIFDAQGREVKEVANNELLGTEGFLRWDGDENNGSAARIGTYMIWFQIFDEMGNVRTMKKRVVLAGRF
jgi:hypothetical protein